jgi:tetratricopeptide (TPR) repeat protein
MKKRMIKMKYFFILLICFISLFFLTGNALSKKNEIVINAEVQYNYAKQCLKEKDYTTAIFEFKRFIYFFKDHEYILNAEFLIGQAFYNLKQYKKAIIALNKIILSEESEIPLSGKIYLAESYFVKSKALMLLGKFNASEVCMQNLLMLSDDKIVRDRAYSFLALLYLKIAETDPDALPRAWEYIQNISHENMIQSQREKLQKVLADMNNLKTKSPAFAGFVSIIPGAGYVYCERYKDGLVSFLFNTALMIAAYKAFDNGNYALGGAISFVETGFYTGNIYGAVNSAHKYNRRKRNAYIKNVYPKFRLKIDNSEEDEQIFLFFEIPF